MDRADERTEEMQICSNVEPRHIFLIKFNCNGKIS